MQRGVGEIPPKVKTICVDTGTIVYNIIIHIYIYMVKLIYIAPILACCEN